MSKTQLPLHILEHDLKSDLQSCCQETEEVGCLFYKLPMFSPLPACSSITRKQHYGWEKVSLLPKTPAVEVVGRLSPLPVTPTRANHSKIPSVPRVPD